MVIFKRDYTVYLNNDNKSESEFTFRRGYSYPCRDEGDYLIVGNIDKSAECRIWLGELEKWIET